MSAGFVTVTNEQESYSTSQTYALPLCLTLQGCPLVQQVMQSGKDIRKDFGLAKSIMSNCEASMVQNSHTLCALAVQSLMSKTTISEGAG